MTSQAFFGLFAPSGVCLWNCSFNMLPCSVFSSFQILVLVSDVLCIIEAKTSLSDNPRETRMLDAQSPFLFQS